MSDSRRRLHTALPAAAAALAGCEGVQHTLDPAGPFAALIAGETWYLLAMAGTVFVLVMAVFLHALFRRRSPERVTPDAVLARVVGGALAVTVVVLLVNLGLDLRTQRALGETALEDPLTIEVTGYQWWWRIEYPHAQPSRRLVTANEIHVPVGRPVRLELRSGDVIHSFWVPRLHGKRDLIPPFTRTLRIRADRPGVYRGQCAEFCGHQHANMSLFVIAEPPAAYERWYTQQLMPAQPPVNAHAEAGQEVFLSGPCLTCHAIRGTPAAGHTAPDLTHVASRRAIAAGTLPFTRENLARWVLDPHAAKPGVKMPGTPLSARELGALVAYLEGLR